MRPESVILALIAAVTATSADAQAAADNCELHIWPTENYNSLQTGLLSGLGAVGALAESVGNKGRVTTVKDFMREYLSPDVQVEELRKANVAETLGLAGYRIVVEPATPSKNSLKDNPAAKDAAQVVKTRLKNGARLSTSTAPCYAELVGTDILYNKAMIYGTNLFAEWTFRDFGRNGATTPSKFGGSVKNRLENFPPKTPDGLDAAKAGIREAYAKDFIEYVQKKVRRAPPVS